MQNLFLECIVTQKYKWMHRWEREHSKLGMGYTPVILEPGR